LVHDIEHHRTRLESIGKRSQIFQPRFLFFLVQFSQIHSNPLKFSPISEGEFQVISSFTESRLFIAPMAGSGGCHRLFPLRTVKEQGARAPHDGKITRINGNASIKMPTRLFAVFGGMAGKIVGAVIGFGNPDGIGGAGLLPLDQHTILIPLKTAKNLNQFAVMAAPPGIAWKQGLAREGFVRHNYRMKKEFVFQIEQDGDTLVATCHEPEMATQGENLDELLAMIRDLIRCRFDEGDEHLAGIA
jgi:hypothetical protein